MSRRETDLGCRKDLQTMSFPHNPHLPQPVDFAAPGLHTRGEHPVSTRRTFSLKPPDTAVATMPIVCIECRRPWLTDGERWRLKVTEDSPPETVPYCPNCARREFGAA
jgi:hypothetical protein